MVTRLGSLRTFSEAPVALCVFFFLFLFSDSVAASPWVQTEKNFLLISRTDHFRADLGQFDDGGVLIESHFERIDAQTYVEFGLTQNVMLGGKAIYGTSWLRRGNDVRTAAGFSEIEAFGQIQVLRKTNSAGSARIGISRPSNFSSGARPALQSDGIDIDASFLYGRNLTSGKIKLFSSLEAGFRKRTGDAADQIRAHATFGIEPAERWLILVESFSTTSLGNQENDGADFDLVKIQPSILWRLSPRLGLQLGATQEIVGRNIDRGQSFFFGIWTRF